jgi:ABC-type glutathione transport system ATPase component
MKIIIHGMLAFILKVQHTPNLSTVCDALSILLTGTKATSNDTARLLNAVNHELKNKLKNTTNRSRNRYKRTTKHKRQVGSKGSK